MRCLRELELIVIRIESQGVYAWVSKFQVRASYSQVRLVSGKSALFPWLVSSSYFGYSSIGKGDAPPVACI